jgi:flagellum-specific peptidoglycan hydrolase FlgJ
MIALDCKGVEILARLLCEDPSSHLVALVLVNLTYDSSPETNTTAIEVTVAGTNINSSRNSSSNSNSNINKIDVIHHDRNGRESGDSDKSSLRKKLLATNGNTALVESLAFALRVSSLTQDEYERRKETIENCNYFSEDFLSPPTRLSILMAKDQQLRSSETEETPIDQRGRLQLQRQKVLPATASPDQILRQLRSNEQELQQWGSIDGTIVVDGSKLVGGDTTCKGGEPSWSRARSDPNTNTPPMVEKSKQIYPDTAKWCLSALRNLTKPCNCDSTAAHVLIKSGIFSLVVQYITTLSGNSTSNSNSSNDSNSNSNNSNSSNSSNNNSSNTNSNNSNSNNNNSNNNNNSGASSTTRSVARMGVSPIEESSSPPCPPTKIALATHHHHQIDDNFLSASYGRVCSRNAVGVRSNAGMFVNGGDDGTMDCGLESRGPTTLPLMLHSANSPYPWESNSMQDAALSIVLNLSASCKSREYINEPHIVKVLSMIAEYPNLVGKRRKSAQITSQESHETMNFQALKAVRYFCFSLQAKIFNPFFRFNDVLMLSLSSISFVLPEREWLCPS